MTSSVDPTIEIVNIEARLQALSGETYQGVPQGKVMPVDAFSNKAPYRDFEPGSSIPAAGQRLLAGHEQQQPHVWAFQIHHYAPTRQQANALAIESDVSLIGWCPSSNAGPISMFYFTMYDEFAKNGDKVGYVATRFYETELGQMPDLGLVLDPAGAGGDGFGEGGYGA